MRLGWVIEGWDRLRYVRWTAARRRPSSVLATLFVLVCTTSDHHSEGETVSLQTVRVEVHPVSSPGMRDQYLIMMEMISPNTTKELKQPTPNERPSIGLFPTDIGKFRCPRVDFDAFDLDKWSVKGGSGIQWRQRYPSITHPKDWGGRLVDWSWLKPMCRANHHRGCGNPAHSMGL